LREVFTRAGLPGLRATDGAGAFWIMVEHCSEVRLAIIDYGLPGMNGDELGRRPRERSLGLPVMFTSGREIEGSRVKLATSGPT